MAIVMDRPVLLGRCSRARLSIDVLPSRSIWDVPTKAGLEGVSTAVGQERRHASSAEASNGRIVECVVAVLIFGIAVDALALRLAPTDSPCTVVARSRNRYDRPNVVLAKISILQNEHSPHRSSHHCRYLTDTEIVQDQLVDAKTLVDWRIRSVSTHFTSSLIVVKGNSGPYLCCAGSPSLQVIGLALP